MEKVIIKHASIKEVRFMLIFNRFFIKDSNLVVYQAKRKCKKIIGLAIVPHKSNEGIIVQIEMYSFVNPSGDIQQITIMAASEHKHIPSLLAMENMFIKIGSAVGSTIAGALWMDEFPEMLARYLPENAQPDLQKIYGSLNVQSSYAYGSPERNGIIEVYSAAQGYMLIAATCLCLVSWSAVLMWRDIDTKNLKKDKNQIF